MTPKQTAVCTNTSPSSRPVDIHELNIFNSDFRSLRQSFHNSQWKAPEEEEDDMFAEHGEPRLQRSPDFWYCEGYSQAFHHRISRYAWQPFRGQWTAGPCACRELPRSSPRRQTIFRRDFPDEDGDRPVDNPVGSEKLPLGRMTATTIYLIRLSHLNNLFYVDTNIWSWKSGVSETNSQVYIFKKVWKQLFSTIFVN